MIAVWAVLFSAPGVSLAAVGVVGAGCAVWRLRVWVARRQAQHQSWIRLVLADDAEVAALEDQLRRVEREHLERP